MVLNFEVVKLRKHLLWAVVGSSLFVEVHVYDKSCGFLARVHMQPFLVCTENLVALQSLIAVFVHTF